LHTRIRQDLAPEEGAVTKIRRTRPARSISISSDEFRSDPVKLRKLAERYDRIDVVKPNGDVQLVISRQRHALNLE
jgi:hypothetical protein